jgi:hypothetical protein
MAYWLKNFSKKRKSGFEQAFSMRCGFAKSYFFSLDSGAGPADLASVPRGLIIIQA